MAHVLVSPGNEWMIQNPSSYDEAVKMDGRHAAHCMIFARSDRMIQKGRYPEKANVLMQFRSDGSLGFPGGFIEPSETILDGLMRELREETSLNPGTLTISGSNWMSSAVRTHMGCTIINHFFAVEVQPDKFKDIFHFEGGTPDDEVRGHIVVPLYTMTEQNNLGHGLPLFLDNVFAGLARPQLLVSLVMVGILSNPEMEHALALARTRPIGSSFNFLGKQVSF